MVRQSTIFFVLSLVLYSGIADAARLTIRGGVNATDRTTGEPVLVLVADDEYHLDIASEQHIDSELIEGISEGGFSLERGNAPTEVPTLSSGKIVREIITHYVLRPTMTGNFKLGPAVIQGNNGEEMSNPLTVRVVTQADLDQLTGKVTKKPVERCSLSVSTERVVIGEPVRATMTLQYGEQAYDAFPDELTAEGLSVVRDERATRTQRFVDGQMVEEISVGYTITPERAGTFTLGPAIGVVVVPDEQNNSFSGNGFAFFSSSFSQKKRRVASEAITLQVDPLPSTNHAVDGIGDFSAFELRATSRATQINEPIEFTLAVSGRGNFEAIVAPELVLPDHMTTYESGTQFLPRGNDMREGVKLFNYVLQIGEAGTHTIPAQEFTYFDTAQRLYKTLRTESHTVVVKSAAGVAATMQSKPADKPIAAPKEEQKEEPAQLPSLVEATIPAAAPLQGVAWWWFLLFALLPLLWLARNGMRRFWAAIAEATGMTSQYKRDHAELQALVTAEETGKLYMFFMGLFARILKEEVSAVTVTMVNEATQGFGWPHRKRDSLQSFLDTCGQASFAPELMTEHERRDMLKKSSYWFEIIVQESVLQRTKEQS